MQTTHKSNIYSTLYKNLKNLTNQNNSCSMKNQTVPQYNISHYGKINTLQHGLPIEDLSNGHFLSKNAYPQQCTTYRSKQTTNEIEPITNIPTGHNNIEKEDIKKIKI